MNVGMSKRNEIPRNGTAPLFKEPAIANQVPIARVPNLRGSKSTHACSNLNAFTNVQMKLCSVLLVFPRHLVYQVLHPQSDRKERENGQPLYEDEETNEADSTLNALRK
ncbi:hypothetical protein V6N13_049621 [Hibiscus sabdariffa]|uniref:Uncharacterized protein n=1 Tax=Hibiscus sabdariffa TaxID=183260 RepID=A0ABR2QWN2_9ROSI